MFYKSFSYWISIFQYSHEKFFTKYKKVCKYRGRRIIPLFDARAGKQQFFTNFHAAASQEVFQERPGLLFLKTSPKKPSFIILQTWILPDYTSQYTNTALKTSRKLCLLVERGHRQLSRRGIPQLKIHQFQTFLALTFVIAKTG